MGDMADYYIDQMEAGRWSSGSFRNPKPHKASYTQMVAMNAGVLHNMDYDGGAYYQVKNSKELGNVDKYIAVVTFVHRLGSEPSEREYDFFSNVPLSEGDIVVVDTVRGLQLAKLVGVKKTSTKATNWVIQRVDLAEHQARIEAEQRRVDLEKKMAKRASEVDKIKRYKSMAEHDPEMAAMVAEYESSVSRVKALEAQNRAAGAPIVSTEEVQATNEKARQAYEDHQEEVSRDRERTTYYDEKD